MPPLALVLKLVHVLELEQPLAPLWLPGHTPDEPPSRYPGHLPYRLTVLSEVGGPLTVIKYPRT